MGLNTDDNIICKRRSDDNYKKGSIITYNQHGPAIKEILTTNWKILGLGGLNMCVLGSRPLVPYRSDKNIKNFLEIIRVKIIKTVE